MRRPAIAVARVLAAKHFVPGTVRGGGADEELARLRAENAQLRHLLQAAHDRARWIGEDLTRLIDGVLAATAPLGRAHLAQQQGNRARRVVDDGWLKDASSRHVAGEKWDAIAADYSISPSRLRELVKKARLPTRGHR